VSDLGTFGEVDYMTTSDLLWRSDWFVAAVSNLIVLGISIASYRQRPRRSVMLIAIAASSGFLYMLVSWVAGTQSPVFWNFLSIVNIGGAVLWVAGMFLLLRELSQPEMGRAGPTTPPNGGPTASVDNSNASGGPPSVS
jgi:peptidoglycan/LPS O-acetylase OafA/YrhL